MISRTHYSIPPEKVSDSLGKEYGEKLVIAPRGTGSHTRMRRVSFEGIGHQRFKKLLPSNTEGEIQGPHPTRRIVSDPLTLRRNHRTDERQISKKSDLIGPDVKIFLDKAVGNPSKGTETLEGWGNVEKLPFIDVSCLKPQSVRCKEIFVSILKNKHVLIELTDVSKKELGIKAMVIDTLQNKVELYLLILVWILTSS